MLIELPGSGGAEMPIFTKLAETHPVDARTYIATVRRLIDGSDPLAVLSATPALLNAAVAEASPAELARPEAPGKRSIIQVVQRLADTELIFAYRIRRVLVEAGPVLEGYDPDLWAERLRYEDANPALNLPLFTALRISNLRLLRAASDAELRRIGRHAERGAETLADMVRVHAAHDRAHLEQIDRIRRSEPA